MLELEFLCFYTNAMDLTKNKFEKELQNHSLQRIKSLRKKSYNLRSAWFNSSSYMLISYGNLVYTRFRS